MKDSQNKKQKKSSSILGFAILISISLSSILLIANIVLIGKINGSILHEVHANPIEVAPLPDLDKDPDINLSAESVMVYNTRARVAVYKKNATLRFSPASTTKIMTAAVALEYYDKNDVLDATPVYDYDASVMGLLAGEKITVRNLIYGLMLPSGNDAALTLANNYPGGYDAFIEKMNKKAEELGMRNTRFVDPSGYDDRNYTTARDLSILAAHTIKDEFFKEVVSTKRIVVYDEKGLIPHDLKNLNRLLDYKDVYGIKTGFTNEAGQVLVTSIEENGTEFVVVVLKSEDRFRDTEVIMADIVRSVKLLSF